MRLFQSKGFTIVELLVVIFIITTLTTVSVAYYRQGEKQLAFQRTVSKVVQDIRRVQEMAMSGKKCPTGVLCTNESRYGIGFERQKKDSYFIFIDNGDGFYKEHEDYILEEVKLGNETEIIRLEIEGTSRNQVFITFLPPDPTTIIKHSAGIPSSLNAKITIKYKTQEKSIEVNKFGLIASD